MSNELTMRTRWCSSIGGALSGVRALVRRKPCSVSRTRVVLQGLAMSSPLPCAANWCHLDRLAKCRRRLDTATPCPARSTRYAATSGAGVGAHRLPAAAVGFRLHQVGVACLG
jgi:hypothetical protein